MKSKTDEEMYKEIMAGGQLERMQALFDTIHGDREQGNAVNELLELAQALSKQAIMKGYHQFDVLETLITANEKSVIKTAIVTGQNKRIEAAAAGATATDGVFKI